MTYQLDAQRYQGLKGWLVLVVIGLIVTPIKLSVLVFNSLLPAFRGETWSVLTSPGSEKYHPLWAPLLIGELSGNALFIVADLGLLVLFFTKSRNFPKAMIAFYLANLVFVAADFFCARLIPSLAGQLDVDSVRELTRTAAGCAIWVPYFLVSKRVKATFIEPRDPLTPPPLGAV